VADTFLHPLHPTHHHTLQTHNVYHNLCNVTAVVNQWWRTARYTYRTRPMYPLPIRYAPYNAIYIIQSPNFKDLARATARHPPLLQILLLMAYIPPYNTPPPTTSTKPLTNRAIYTWNSLWTAHLRPRHIGLYNLPSIQYTRPISRNKLYERW